MLKAIVRARLQTFAGHQDRARRVAAIVVLRFVEVSGSLVAGTVEDTYKNHGATCTMYSAVKCINHTI